MERVRRRGGEMIKEIIGLILCCVALYLCVQLMFMSIMPLFIDQGCYRDACENGVCPELNSTYIYGSLGSRWFSFIVSCTCRNETGVFTYNYYQDMFGNKRDEII